MPKKVLIMGAAGKDFHVFNTCYRDNPDFEVMAFTAAQIPHIDNRFYPAVLAGRLYPDGIQIKSERFLSSLIKENRIDEAIFAYSDVSYDYLETRRQKVQECGAEFKLPDPQQTMLKSTKPVIAICAVRTGSGKSQTTRRIAAILREKKKKVAVVRHPMPYGDLAEQIIERFETMEDLDKYKCTIEEREEFEPHLRKGFVVFAGVDYEKILREAEKEADIILWDGGNNDTPFFKPNLHITVADPLRHGHELSYYPGRLNFEMADVIIINKMDSAKPNNVDSIIRNAQKYNPRAVIIKANSPVTADKPELIKGKKVLVIEDGPTVTHGDMKFGAGYLAAQKYQAGQIIDPRPFAIGEIAEAYQKYPQTEFVLPALGYGNKQIKELETVIERSDCELVIIGTPVDLGRILKINKPSVRVTYELEEISQPDLKTILDRFA
ncbi:MAG: cyclic 2,3-diphosphoglycerate synthase [Planctomycetota bacterium]